MSIVLVNHYAGDGKNGMEYRPYEMAKRWVANGENVTIVASSYSHLRSKNPDIGNQPYAIETIDGIRYVWIKGNEYKGNGVGRIRNMLSFLYGLYRHGDVFADKACEAIIASSTYPLDIYTIRKLAKKRGAKFIFELHDMWPASPMELGGMSAKHPYIRIMQKAENDWCRTADAVVSILPATRPYLVDHGLKPERFHYIPNGIDKTVWTPDVVASTPNDHQEFLDQLHREGCFVVGYAGGHTQADSLETLIEAISLTDNPLIKAVLVGQGSHKEQLIKMVEKSGLSDRVYFLSPIPKTQIPKLLDSFDALFAAAPPSKLYRFGVSLNKMMDYMMSGKPVISAIDAANDYVKESNCGFSVPSRDPKTIADALDKLATMSEDERNVLGENGRSYILENNDYDALSQRFLEIIQS